jgi:MFS family permease
VCAVPVLQTLRRAEYFELAVMFFLHGAAMGMWFAPLSTVLGAYGLDGIRSYAFATTALAAFVSPLLFGAIADRHMSPVKVLRGLAFVSAATLALVGFAIQQAWNPWLVLGLIQLFSLVSAPTWSIVATIVFARLADARRQFGPVRAMATSGWMSGCWVISLAGADRSVRAQFVAAAVWLLVAAYTFCLPVLEAPRAVAQLTWRQRLGLDSLQLLRHADHRVVLITVALFSIPIAAFYPYAPPNLVALGFHRTTAWMSLAQVSEVIAVLLLAWLLMNWRLKWIFIGGLALGILRFALSAFNTPAGLLAGIALHGCSFAWVVILAQIYIDQRVDPSWRARAQAFLYVMSSGFGSLFGYLGSGWWFEWSGTLSTSHWPLFWGGVAAAVGAVFVYFVSMYRGVGTGLRRPAEDVSTRGI